MKNSDLVPYALARQRFSHACGELADQERPINERLLAAIVALSPLRPEDMPRSCQSLYEKVQQRVGPGLWASDSMGSALATSVRSLSPQSAKVILQWILMASDSLDKHCSIENAPTDRFDLT